MLRCNDFSAWVTVDGIQLECYSEQTSSDGRTVTCWIASEVGKAFHIHWEHSSAFLGGATGAYLNVDGFNCGGVALRPSLGQTKGCMTGFGTSDSTEKPLMFSSLDLTDDDCYLDNGSGIQNLGQIKLVLRRVEFTNTINATWQQPDSIPKDRKVHERTKKAGSHSVKLGDDVVCKKQMQVTVKALGIAPVAIFIFRYNPIEVLRANGIAPPPPAQAPQVSASSESGNAKLKRKRENTRVETEGDEVVFVGEPVPHASKSSRKKVKKELLTDQQIYAKGEVIDLSGDEAKKVKREPLTDRKVFAKREVVDLSGNGTKAAKRGSLAVSKVFAKGEVIDLT
ncbi:hypothetical protein OE88DRAFT_1722095 [Heliocybe sulcata]|uniref:DUF7918 domain-containing protein n=1 Tax=Heliocybe sulcata TaxID=5364 RepID=A0A5C3NGQ7_9AGAM|nr:hypothetical protein OE88DRAFT_1722095 [Heliocybe sulcata]